MQDVLVENGMYDAAVSIGAGVAIGKIGGIIIDRMGKKFGTKVAFKLGLKTVPYVGWALMIFSLYEAAKIGKQNALYCASDLDIDTHYGYLK